MKPIFSYMGSKGYMVIELAHILKNSTFNTDRPVIEIFGGSASLSFALESKQSLINDTNADLINFYESFRSDDFQFIDDPYTHKNYYRNRDIWNKFIRHKVRSKNIFYPYDLPNIYLKGDMFRWLLTGAYSNQWRVNKKGDLNIPFCNPKNVPDGEGKAARLKSPPDIDYDKYKDVIRGWTFTNMDCFDLLSYYSSLKDECLIFADPPYLDTAGYNGKVFGLGHHKRLHERLTELHIPVLFTHKYDAIIDSMYKNSGFGSIEFLKNRGLGKFKDILYYKNIVFYEE